MSDPAQLVDDGSPWVPGPRVVRPPLGSGPLNGLRVAVKDLIDVGGAVTGAGNPEWAQRQQPAERDADAVEALRRAGASIDGKTITDEFAFSLEGENAHHGTPRNPRAPDRLPGGSSSGSAVAVASSQVDAALGTDTGGSVRVPASFCGVFGFRPTHGAVRLRGVLPFAPSYDTVGWFARDGDTLKRVGTALLPPSSFRAPSLAATARFTVVRDAFELADRPCAEQLSRSALQLQPDDTTDVFVGGSTEWLQAYAVLQGAEVRAQWSESFARHRPRLGNAIAERFDSLAAITDDDIARWRAWRIERTVDLQRAVTGGRLLVLPTTPGPALLRSSTASERGDFYARALALNSIAGHAGLPQVTLPSETHDGKVDGAPIGLSVVGPRGSDAALLDLAARWTP